MASFRRALSGRVHFYANAIRVSWKFYQGNIVECARFVCLYNRVCRHTHASPIDLLHLRAFVRQIKNEGLSGDIVECGSWRGGSSALMYKTAQELGWTPAIYIYDSFEGFPKPAAAEIDGKKAQGIHEGRFDWIKASEANVVEIFKKLNLYSDKVHIVKGWFCDTTPKSPVRAIALLHCDGDLYQSTKDTLDSFYSKVVPGGFVVSNDYGDVWIGAKKAVDECIAANCPGVKIVKIPGGGAYFRKP